MNKCATSGEKTFQGSIVHINTSGFTVKLDENGLEGVVDLRSHKDKFSFDKWEMSLSSKSARFALGQSVSVEYLPTDKPRGAQAAFAVIAEESQEAPETADTASHENGMSENDDAGSKEQETA